MGKCREGYLVDFKNRKISYCSFIPKGSPKAQLYLQHGLSENILSYYHVAEALAEQGIAVHMMDLPGHGRSDGTRGHIDDFQDFVDNLEWFIQVNPNQQMKIPTFLLGHSMGGLIAKQYCLRNQSEIAGLLLCAPFAGLSKMKRSIYNQIARLLSLRDSELLVYKGVNPPSLTRNPAKWRNYRKDIYRVRWISPKFVLELMKAGHQIQQKAAFLTLPVILFLGKKDRVISVEQTEKFFFNLGSEDKNIVVFTDALHELFQEFECDQVVQRVARWIDDHLEVSY